MKKHGRKNTLILRRFRVISFLEFYYFVFSPDFKFLPVSTANKKPVQPPCSAADDRAATGVPSDGRGRNGNGSRSNTDVRTVVHAYRRHRYRRDRGPGDGGTVVSRGAPPPSTLILWAAT